LGFASCLCSCFPQHQSDLDAAKTRKQHELEIKREAKKAELAATNKKDM
jgi:hypothetical protein